MERKILLFAKLMSLCFAGMGLFSLCDLFLTPKSQIQYVLAHETETGYRSTSKYGAQNFRDNYLHCVSFRSHIPYRLRPGYEIDTLLLYQTPEIRTQEAKDYLLAQKMNQARNTAKLGTQSSLNISDETEDFLVSKVPVDLKTYYDLEDGDSIRLFVSPLRSKIVGYTQFHWHDWLNMSEKQMQASMNVINPDLKQWLLTTQVFSLIALVLCGITWMVKQFHISVGLFVFNCVITAMLHWVY